MEKTFIPQEAGSSFPGGEAQGERRVIRFSLSGNRKLGPGWAQRISQIVENGILRPLYSCRFLNFTSNNFEETYIGENDSPRRKNERKITKAAGLGLGLKFPPVGKEKLSEGCKCVKVKLGYAGLHIYIYLQNDFRKILFAGKIVSGLKFPSVGRMISCLLLQWMQMAES